MKDGLTFSLPGNGRIVSENHLCNGSVLFAFGASVLCSDRRGVGTDSLAKHAKNAKEEDEN